MDNSVSTIYLQFFIIIFRSVTHDLTVSDHPCELQTASSQPSGSMSLAEPSVSNCLRKDYDIEFREESDDRGLMVMMMACKILGEKTEASSLNRR